MKILLQEMYGTNHQMLHGHLIKAWAPGAYKYTNLMIIVSISYKIFVKYTVRFEKLELCHFTFLIT